MTKLTITKTLKRPITLAGEQVSEIEVRPSTMADLVEAEKDASAMQVHSFNVQMASIQVVRAGSKRGPFMPADFLKLRPQVFTEIMTAIREADELGEA